MPKGLPTTTTDLRPAAERRVLSRGNVWRLAVAAILAVALVQLTLTRPLIESRHDSKVPLHAEEILDKCRLLHVKPGPPEDFNLRKQSDRFVPGTKSTLIKNATIWTGRVEGLEVIKGDLLLQNGLVKDVGRIDQALLSSIKPDDLATVDANGAWVSPGIVDLHSHIGVSPSPGLRGTNDGNSRKGPILPWLRALDALNTHSDAYTLSISGGVTTSLVLPGSANAIGGQGIVIKLRPTAERSPTAMLLENPYSINQTDYDPSLTFRFRQMKHACGENPDRVYSQTRMDTAWAFRQAYDKARQIKVAQDEYCVKALSGDWSGLAPEFPQDLQWEALVDVLRGRVKVHTHCYETVDLDDLVRITNEFKFSIAAFHHAHETYLVPETLKSAYGHPPAVALFATNARYKRESYRGSEFAPRILADNNLQVVMKSDHPVLDSRFLLYEAQQAHYYGLPDNLALLSVTGTPAQVLGMDHRIGFLKKGYDADVVLWDSHPLALGATPQQVWIDGIPQLSHPHVHAKPPSLQHAPKTPNFDKDAELALQYEGLPPLLPEHSTGGLVVFTNVSQVLVRGAFDVVTSFKSEDSTGVVVVQDGELICAGLQKYCRASMLQPGAKQVDLEGGAVAPALISFGHDSGLGLEEISGEISTSDGWVFDALLGDVPSAVGGDNAIIRAADGLQYATRNALLAYRSGVTTAVTPPKSSAFFAGISAAFGTGARHQLEKGALPQSEVAVHLRISHIGAPSVSTQIAALRRLLLGEAKHDLEHSFKKVAKGEVPLVIEVHSADAMASLIRLKREVESHQKHHKTSKLQFVFSGATEAHLLAPEIADADIGVIISPARPYPSSWEQRRILAGPPLTEQNAVAALVSHNVTVALGVSGSWAARNTRFDAAWAALETGGKLSDKDAIALVTTNLEKLLGLKEPNTDLVATTGGTLLDFESKVVAVISPKRGLVDIL